jgi:hypothetical protein
MKLILYILWLKFKVDAYNGIHDFTLFKFLKDVSILTLYIPLNALTSNLDILVEIDNLNEIEWIIFP